jgi:hypothetical protein
MSGVPRDGLGSPLKDSDVDTVFMTLKNTFGTGLIQAADNIGYHPKWLLEGNETTATVLKFFDSVKTSLDGSVVTPNLISGLTAPRDVAIDAGHALDAPVGAALANRPVDLVEALTLRPRVGDQPGCCRTDDLTVAGQQNPEDLERLLLETNSQAVLCQFAGPEVQFKHSEVE